ncbi:MAG: FlgD immunoglobulin-like domain containing protein, partial [bacterium]
YQEANQGLDCKRVFNLTLDPHNPHIVWLGTSGTGVYRGEFSITPIEESVNSFCIYSNLPNPFKSQTAISYSLPYRGNVSLQIFDLSGRLIRNLFNGEKSPGVHTVKWDGKDDKGSKVVQGIYFYMLELQGRRMHQKLVLLR